MSKPKKDDGVIELNATSALEQAGNVLLLATEKANYNNDVDAMLKIALGWMEIHEYLAGIPHHEKEKQFGFASTKADLEEEEEELEPAIATEGFDKPRIHAEHGKFRIAQG